MNDLAIEFIKGGPGSGDFGHEGRPGEVGGSGGGGGGTKQPHQHGGKFQKGTTMGTLYETLKDGQPKSLSGLKSMLSAKNPDERIATLAKIGKQTGKWEVSINKANDTITLTHTTPGPKPESAPKPVEAPKQEPWVQSVGVHEGNQREISNKWYGTLSTKEKAAVEYYTGFGHNTLNKALRVQSDTVDPKVIETARELHNAIDKSSIPNDTVVYRGIKSEAFVKLKVGTVFVDHGFTSTSIDRSRASHSGGHVMQISVPKGYKAAVINGNSSHPSEHEVLFQRGSFYKVHSIVGTTIRVEAI
jgi:hypothetical protein